MLIDLDALKNRDFSLRDIHVIMQRPLYRKLEVPSRLYNGFINIKKGEGVWRWQDGECTFSAGALVYLPLNSSHTFFIHSQEVEFYRIDFQLRIDDEIALFSNVPMKLAKVASPECVAYIRALYTEPEGEENHLFRIEKLCGLLRALQKQAQGGIAKKLMPAITHIGEHFTEPIDGAHLASLCYLSSSHFYALFKEEFGVTPLAYRNRLLISRAMTMLQVGDTSVKEIASVLGFLSDGYFCRFFKKQTGMTPKEWKVSRMS